MTISTSEDKHQSSIDDHVKAENTKFLKRMSKVQESMNLLMTVMRKEMGEHEKKMSKLLSLKADKENSEIRKRSTEDDDNKVSKMRELGKSKNEVETKFELSVSSPDLSQRGQKDQDKVPQKRISTRGFEEPKLCGGPQSTARLGMQNKLAVAAVSPTNQTLKGQKKIQSFLQNKLLPVKLFEQSTIENEKFKRNHHNYSTSLYESNMIVPPRCLPASINSTRSGHLQLSTQRQFGYFHPQDPEDVQYLAGNNCYGYGYPHEAYNQSQPSVQNGDVLQRGVWQESQVTWGPQRHGYGLYRNSPSEPGFHIQPAYHDNFSSPHSPNLMQHNRMPNSYRLELQGERNEFLCKPNSIPALPIFQRHQDHPREYQQLQTASPKQQISRKKKLNPAGRKRIVPKPIFRKPPFVSSGISQFGKLSRSVNRESQNVGISLSKFHPKRNGVGRPKVQKFSKKSIPRAGVLKKSIKGLNLGPHDPKIAVVRERSKITKKNRRKMRRMQRSV